MTTIKNDDAHIQETKSTIIFMKNCKKIIKINKRNTGILAPGDFSSQKSP